MAKRYNYGSTAFMMTLFVYLFPMLVSGFDKKAIVYASLCLCLSFLTYETLKKEYMVVSKSFLIAFGAGIYGLLSLIYVSDKGSGIYLASLLLLLGVVCALSMFVKQSLGEEVFQRLGEDALYKCGAIYSTATLLWQVFIDSKFISRMDLGNGSNSASAIIAFLGIASGMSLYKKGKRNIGYFLSMAVMLYCFIMAKSIVAFLMVAVIVFVIALNMRHKKVEAFGALLVSGVIFVIGLIYTITLFITDAVGYKGAIYGLVSVFGVGNGGYGAVKSVLGISAAYAQNTAFLMMESFGVFGLAFVVLALWGVVVTIARRKSLSSLVIGATFIASVFSSIQAFTAVAPLCCVYYGASSKAISIKIHKAVAFLSCPAIVLCALFFFARVPYALGQNAYDTGEYKKGENYFEMSASLALFDSESWEKAYDCAEKNDLSTGAAEREYLEKAIKFNKKNYEYKKQMAASYTKEGDFNSALTLWEEIMAKYNDECLYEEYATKIMLVMSTFPDRVRMEELYNRIGEYAKKTTDKDVKFKVNNILTKSQSYYIESRENGGIVGDMYRESVKVEEATEYESSSTES